VIFMSNISHSHTYTVRRETMNYGPQGQPIKGSGPQALRAKFKGNQRLFDSEAAQRSHNWSDAERLEVEAHLLGHKDFMAAPGRSGEGVQPRIYLAPGQTVPPEHQQLYAATLERLASEGRLPATEVADAASALPAPPMHCLAFDTSKEGIVRCSKLAAQGSDLCEEDHKSQVAVA